MKHLFIINPKAGIKDSTEYIKNEIKKVLQDGQYEVYVTKEPGDAETYVKEYLTNNSEQIVRVYSCGGDGTLNEVLNGSIGFSNCELTCYPSGSGNDFLKCFPEAEKFLDFKELIDGEIVTTDVIKVKDRYSLNIFNMGFDANVVVMQSKLKKLPLVSGKLAYNLSVFFSAFGKVLSYLKITIDDEVVFDEKGILCAVANGICYGGGYYCAPLAQFDDGILDVIYIKRASLFKFARLASRYKDGTYLDSDVHAKYISYRKGKKVRIESDRKINYSIDGEIYKSEVVDIEIVPQAIRFVIPQIHSLRKD